MGTSNSKRALLLLLALALSIVGCRIGFLGRSAMISKKGTVVPAPFPLSPATRLMITGPNASTAGTCAGPYTIEGLDSQGNPAAAFPNGTSFQIVGTGPDGVSLTPACESSTNGNQVPTTSETNTGTFYMFQRLATPRVISATTGDLQGSINVLTLPGAPSVLQVIPKVNLAQNQCTPISFLLTDAYGNSSPALNALTFGIAVSGIPGAALYSDANCQTPTNQLALSRASYQGQLQAYIPSAGTFQIQVYPSSGVSGETVSFSVLPGATPHLLLTSNAQSTAGACDALTVTVLDSNNQSLTVRLDTPVVFSGSDPSISFYSDSCQTPLASNTAVISAFSNGLTLFYSSKKAPLNALITASASGLVSGSLSKNWIAGPPAELSMTGLIQNLPATQCSGPESVTFLDAFGNVSTTPQSSTLFLTPSGAAGGSTSIYSTPDCSGVATASLAVPLGSSSSTYSFLSPNPGTLTITVTSGTLTSDFKSTTIQNDVGYPTRLQLQPPTGTLTAGTCIPISANLLDSLGNPVNVSPNPLTLALSQNGSGNFFLDGVCTNPVTGGNPFTLAVGSNHGVFYVKDFSAATLDITAVDAINSSGVTANTSLVISPAIATSFKVSGPTSAPLGQCSGPVNVATEDAYSNPVAPTYDVAITLQSDPSVTFYSDNQCNNSVGAITLPSGRSNTVFYFKGQLLETAAILLEATNFTTGGYSVSFFAPNWHLALSTQVGAQVPAGQCFQMTATITDANNNPYQGSPVLINLSSTQLAGNIFFSDSSCQTAIPYGNFFTTQNQNSAFFYMRPTVAETLAIEVTAINLNLMAGASFLITPSSPLALRILSSGSDHIFTGVCSGPYTVELDDAYGNPSPPTTALSLNFSSQGGGTANFFADALCSQSTIGIPSNQTASAFYIKGTSPGTLNVLVDASGVQQGSRSISVDSDAQIVLLMGAVAATPINFGSINTGTTSAPVLVTLKNSGSLVAGVVSLNLTGGAFAVSGGNCPATPFNLGPNSQCDVGLVFSPSAPGPASGSFSVTYNNSAGQVATPTIALSGNGNPPATALLTVASQVNFGNVFVGTSNTQDIQITNTGATTATNVTPSTLSSPFSITLDPSCNPLPQGGQCLAHATFAPQAIGAQTEGVSFNYNNGQTNTFSSTTSLTGTGETPAQIVGNPNSVNFGNVLATQTSSPVTVQFTNLGTTDAQSVSVNLSGNGYAIISNTCGATLPTAASCSVGISFSPTASANYTGTLTVNYNTGNGTSSTAISISGNGLAPALVSLTPSPLNFGSVPMGATPTQTVVVYNQGDVSATSLAFSIASPQNGFSIQSGCPATLAAHTSCLMTIQWQAPQIGTSSATLNGSYNNGLQGSTTAPVTLSGFAFSPPNIVASANTANFGTVLVGSSAPNILITLTNQGGAETATSVSGVSGPFSFSGCQNVTLLPQGTCTLTLGFQSNTALNFSQNLQVTYSGQTAPLNIALLGVAVNTPVLTASPATLNFGNSVVGVATASQTVTLANNGQTNITQIQFSVPAPFLLASSDCGTLPATLSGGTSCHLGIQFKPTALGANSKTMNIAYFDGKQNRSTAVQMSGTGVTQARLSVSAATLNFPNTIVGGSSAIQVTVTNTGGATATGIQFIPPTSNAFGLSTACGSQLGASASCTLTFTFSPTALASFSDTNAGIHYFNGVSQVNTFLAPGNVAVNHFTLSGSGAGPALLSYSTNPLSLGSVKIGKSRTLSTTVTNTGGVSATSLSIYQPLNIQFTSTSNCPATLNPTKSCQISVTFKPTAVGTFSTTTGFTYNNGVTVGTKAVLNLSGTGH